MHVPLPTSSFERRGASWVLWCLCGCVSWHMVGEGGYTDYNTQNALGSHQGLRLQPREGKGREERGEGLPAAAAAGADGVGLLQGLKEKTTQEKDGKDAATNGKVVALPSASSCHTRRNSPTLLQENEENGSPDVREEEGDDLDEEDEDDVEGKRRDRVDGPHPSPEG